MVNLGASDPSARKENRMGTHVNVGFENFPKQGQYLGKSVEVTFNYNISHIISGVIVRDDVEEPFRTIIQLEDGRYIEAVECQYHVK